MPQKHPQDMTKQEFVDALRAAQNAPHDPNDAPTIKDAPAPEGTAFVTFNAPAKKDQKADKA